MTRMRRPTVLIASKTLPHYRIEFFTQLRERLQESGVELRLTYGQPNSREQAKHDTADLPWADYVPNRFIRVARREAIWQPILAATRHVDLVIVEQASRLLVNYALLARQLVGRVPVAFWGHGGNLQTHTANQVSEAVKRVVSRWPHWWFAYTDGTRDRVSALGYPTERITVVQNAIDTARLREQRASITEDDLWAFRREFDLGSGPIGAFVGGLYPEKRLEFLFDAADRIHREQPDFRLVVVGSGEQRAFVEESVRQRAYTRYLGTRFGHEKVVPLAASDVILMPGLVGLVILDSFALQVPLITTAINYHSPEIEYLVDGENGTIVRDAADAEAYAAAVRTVLTNGGLERLRRGCEESARVYTNEAMVDRFAGGIIAALGAR